jgi:ABC-type oligopeptide transport system substrate-binding subunit
MHMPRKGCLNAFRAVDYWTAPALWVSLAALLLLSGCSPIRDAATNAEGTPQATAGVGAIVTRIVEQITFVTRTPDPTAQAEASREPVELDISLSGELPNLDPGIATEEAQLDLAQNLFISLTNYNPASNLIEPEFARTWDVSPDGLTWTFNLRDDVYWVRPSSPPLNSDELWSVTPIRPVVADDVVFAVQRLCSREAESPLAFSLFIIEGCEAAFTNLQPTDADRAAIGIEAISPTMLEVRLTKPAAYFLTITSLPFFQPVPRDLVTEMGDEWRDAAGELGTGWQTPDNLVTSGPYFAVPPMTTSASMVLHRNPLWPIEKVGNVDVVNIYFFDDEVDAYELWRDRGLDIAPLPTEEREAFMERSASNVLVTPDQVLFYIGFNFDSQVFREPEVRRAFSAAIDRQRLIDELYNGRGITMRHATVPGIVAAVPAGEVGVGYSPDYARQQMAESTQRSCSLMPPVTLLVSSADLSLRQAEMIRNMWVEELGCLQENINIEQVPFGTLLAQTSQTATGRPDMWELAWAPTFPDAHNLLNDLLHSEDSENRQNRPPSEVDDLMRRASESIDASERIALYRQAESLFFSETGLFPIAPLYIRARERIVQSWISFTPTAFGGQQWDRIALDADTKELERSLDG